MEQKSKRFFVGNVKIRLTEAPVPNSTHAAYDKIFRQPLIDNRLVDFVCHNTFSYTALLVAEYNSNYLPIIGLYVGARTCT